MIRNLDDFDEVLLRIDSGENDPGVFEHLAITVVEFIAMAVAFADERLAIAFISEGAFLDGTVVSAKT